MTTENSFAREVAQHGIGQKVLRKEDAMLLKGQGAYTDDLNLPGQAHAVMVRSPIAHGILRDIDTTQARAMPGVLGVFTGQDLAQAGFGGIRTRMAVTQRDGTPMQPPVRPALPTDKVRFAGEAVAFVVAETRDIAKSAAEAVILDIEALPALCDPLQALAPDAPALHAGLAGNVVLDFHYGDTDRVSQAFATALHVATLKVANSRIVVNSMEPRTALASFDPAATRWTLHTPSQGVFGLRESICKDVLGMDTTHLHVLTGNVGGSFGMKSQPYPEQICLLHAARVLGRPVKWTDSRSESFLSDHHGRSADCTISLALDAEGHFLALKLELITDIGAFMVAPQPATLNAVRNIIGPYLTPLLQIDTKAVLTNKTPVGAYRGAGRPEANYYMSRVIDEAARQTGIDPIELRRRNLIPAISQPHKTAGNTVYDSGNFAAVLDHALRMSDWDGFAARRAESAANGRLRGRGISLYLEATGPQGKEMGGIRFDGDGGVTMITGTLDYGQGHASAFAQVLVDRLGIPFDRLRLLQGDSDALIAGGGTGGSKSLMSSGQALVTASEAVIEKGRKAASRHLEAAVVDIEFAEGRFTVAGTDRSIGLMDLAAQPDADLDASLIADTPPSSYPNGCHIAEVEIDPETGIATVVRYAAANDFGVVVNPLLVEGQVQGGVVQGIGQVLGEAMVYDSEGQMLTGSFMDYAMPRADDAPWMRIENLQFPATTNALGVKGCGEAGCAGAIPSVMGAIVDALSARGITHFDMPATPERVWSVLHG